MSEQTQITESVQAFSSGIKSLTAKEREQKPSGGYGETYNNLLAEAKKNASTANPKLWPPPVKVTRFPGNHTESDVKYAELVSYAAMIVVQLSQGQRPNDPHLMGGAISA